MGLGLVDRAVRRVLGAGPRGGCDRPVGLVATGP